MAEGCNDCKKNAKNFQLKIFILGSYIFVSSIYGTIEIVKHLIDLFK